jgi:putative transcriptional regulator
MKHAPDYEKMTVYEQILTGLKQAIAFERGEISLRTTTLVARAPQLSARRVAAIRRKTGMSQAVFAAYLNVPKKTLQSWEQGARQPKAGEARLLQIVESDPSGFAALVLRTAVRKTRVRRGPLEQRARKVA